MVLKRIKRVVLWTLKRIGVFHLALTSNWRKQRLVILCYHGVSLDDEHLWHPYMFIPPEVLETRLALLRSGGYNTLPLGEAVERLYLGSLPARSVAVTFDDGLFDFYAQAWPLLRKYEIPATVYLTTHYCDYNRPVFDVIVPYLLWKGRGSGADLRGMLGFPANLALAAGRERAAAELLTRARRDQLSSERKDRLAADLATAVGVDYEEILRRRILHLMNPTETAELAAAGADIQLHTHRHRTPMDRHLFALEIEKNRARILAMTGRRATHFCYPEDERPEFLPWLSELDVASATTSEPRLASPRSHPLLLPRVVDHSRLELLEVESLLTGAGSLLPRRASSTWLSKQLLKNQGFPILASHFETQVRPL